MSRAPAARAALRLLPIAALAALGCDAGAPPAGAGPTPHSAAHSSAASEPAGHGNAAEHAAHAEHAAPAEHAAHANHTELPADAPLPGQSLYHQPLSLTEHTGQPLALDAFKGKAVLVTMFYASCTTVCPLLIGQLAALDKQLTAEQREQTELLLVSLDPERDTPERLVELAKRHGVNDGRFHFATTPEPNVRLIAALLGIRYRKLPDGELSHSPVVALLDRDGVVAARSEGTRGETAELLAALGRVVASRPATHSK